MRAAAPATRRSSRASWASRAWSGPAARRASSPADARSPCRCAEGDDGKVYDGRVPFERTEIDPATLPAPRVPLMLNLANPDRAFQLAQLPSAGVGLVRIEFVISSWIGVHPMALVHPERVDRSARPRPRSGGATAGCAVGPRILRRAAGLGRRADRGRLLPPPGHRALLRLQDQRVRRPARRRGVRAQRSRTR